MEKALNKMVTIYLVMNVFYMFFAADYYMDYRRVSIIDITMLSVLLTSGVDRSRLTLFVSELVQRYKNRQNDILLL